jgi:hypothetical protein
MCFTYLIQVRSANLKEQIAAYFWELLSNEVESLSSWTSLVDRMLPFGVCGLRLI